MGELTRIEAAERAGVGVDEVNRLIEARVISPDPGDQLSTGDVRRVRIIESLRDGGFPLEEIPAGVQQGAVNLDFARSPTYQRLAALATQPFHTAGPRPRPPPGRPTGRRAAIGGP